MHLALTTSIPTPLSGLCWDSVWTPPPHTHAPPHFTSQPIHTHHTHPSHVRCPTQMAREALLASIREDYDVNYFISGQGSMAGYAPDCTFADPFVSFQGVERFRRNVSNLGGLMSQVRAEGAAAAERVPRHRHRHVTGGIV